MTQPATRAALVARFNAVPDIGRVHDYQRFSQGESDFRKLYLYTPAGGGQEHLRGWQISSTGTTERTLGLGRVLINRAWTVRGYLGLNDKERSEVVLDELCEAVAARYRADPTLGGACAAEMFGDGPDGVQKADAGAVNFCGVLCNSAVLQLNTWEYGT